VLIILPPLNGLQGCPGPGAVSLRTEYGLIGGKADGTILSLWDIITGVMPRKLFFCFLPWIVSCLASAQEPQTPAQTSQPPAQAPQTQASASQTQQDPQIRVQVNDVIVPVTVTDSKGRFVSNLDKEDFQIFDQGQPQSIQYFSRERNQPVVVGFLMDLSNASKS
jgi:hypothetical protein